MAYDLPAIIRTIPDFATLTPTQCLEYLSSETTVLKTVRYNSNDMMKLLGVDLANSLASKLQELGYPLVVGQLCTERGIDFGDAVTQAMFDQLSSVVEFASYVATLKALGQDTRTRWARLSADTLPDVAEFETAHAEALLVEQKLAAGESLATLMQAINDRINAGTLTAAQIATITIPE